MMIRSGPFVALFLALIVLPLTACGGSDSDQPGPEGTYFYTALFGVAATGDGLAQWGSLEADGQGLLIDSLASQNLAGVVVGPGPLFGGTIPIEVGPGTRLTWGTGESPVGPLAYAAGGVRSDGSLGVLSNVQGDSFPGLMVIGKQKGTWNLASLDGLYHFGILYRNPVAQDGTIRGVTTFHGDGTGDSEAYVNFLGNQGGPFSYEDTYTVEADGRMSWALGGNLGTYHGGILAGGDVLIMAGQSENNGSPSILVMVRECESASNRTFEGDYHVVTLHALLDTLETEWVSATGSAYADGDGEVTFRDLTMNADGEIQEEETGPSTSYSVDADGALQFGGGDLDACQGGIGAHGRFVVASGGVEEDSNPQIWILLRK